MTPAVWITLAIVGGFVWGGFLILLAVALSKERGKEAGEKGLHVP